MLLDGIASLLSLIRVSGKHGELLLYLQETHSLKRQKKLKRRETRRMIKKETRRMLEVRMPNKVPKRRD